MANDFYLQCSRGFLDALIDLSRDLRKSDTIDPIAFDNDGSRKAIIESVEKRIGKPSEIETTETPEFQKYFDTHKGEKWLEGRLTGYTETLRMLCYLDCGSGSGQALIDVGSWFESEYGILNTIANGGMESLIDQIADEIGSPPAPDEGYANGYRNMLRMLGHLASIHGI